MTTRQRKLKDFNRQFGEELMKYNSMGEDVPESFKVMQAARINEMIQIAWILNYEIDDKEVKKLDKLTFDYCSDYFKKEYGRTYRSHALRKYRESLNRKMYYIVNDNDVLMVQCPGLFNTLKYFLNIHFGLFVKELGLGEFSEGFDSNKVIIIHGIDALCKRYKLSFTKAVEGLRSGSSIINLRELSASNPSE